MDIDMGTPEAEMAKLPVPLDQLVRHISEHPDDAVMDILAPYRRFESRLRSVFAQDPQNPILKDPHVTVLPLFSPGSPAVTTRARNLAAESDEEKARYIMPLPDDKRRPHGSPATVPSLAQFQKNFSVFSESSLVDLDWSNVVAAGSSVVNCLLPVPPEFDTTKRKLREYYHEKFCPASDVDLFLYGLTEEQAIAKIKQIERAVRDALLNEVTVVRTKHAITIASQYPVRHVQIVLRVYKSVSEILTGFDIDAAGGAYDGSNVYVTPRALGSFITQVNHVDLSRRSPSYENRLSKYSHRNFEVYWPDLDRSRVDPTVFERSFRRTLGLARLLVLERLPTSSAREAYLNKRRSERGRPPVNRPHRYLGGNIKDVHEDEVADWVAEEDVSNYNTFTIPYGQKYNAKRIEKLCYTRDLLLNAEWNQPKEREVHLHRHPAFFGRAEDVIEDCCGSCPVPQTEQEKEVAEKESAVYISGKISFITDDPGRQQIGSFNPLTDQDWTDMAYVGNTARLCQSIVDGDTDDVLNWMSHPEADPNTRDYTGRTPLHLAVIASTPDMVKCLVDHGARLTSRLADGRTALHLAASRGDTDMIKILMEKSIENEELEDQRQGSHRPVTPPAEGQTASASAGEEEGSEEDEDSVKWKQSQTDAHSVTTGSFVKVSSGAKDADGAIPETTEEGPDFYNIDVLAWDVPCSPLHLAIVGGHQDSVKLLCDYGADSILPIKYTGHTGDGDAAAILTLTLALSLPPLQARSMARLLLSLGAVSSQADNNGTTAFSKYVEHGSLDLINTLLEHDKTAAAAAIKHLSFAREMWIERPKSPLHKAIEHKSPEVALKMLEAGAQSVIDFETWLKAAKLLRSHRIISSNPEANRKRYKIIEQPLISAAKHAQVDVALALLANGADPNTITPSTEELLANPQRGRWMTGETVLDLVQQSMAAIREEQDSEDESPDVRKQKPGIDEYLANYEPGTYSHWIISEDIKSVKENFRLYRGGHKVQDGEDKMAAREEKKRILKELIGKFENLERTLLSKGAKTFSELHPTVRSAPHTRPSRLDNPPTPYQFVFKFQGDSSMTDQFDFKFQGYSSMMEKRQLGYISLFEAAWAGDLERIKELTMKTWGPEKDQAPLIMAVTDTRSNGPFSLAFVRGHYHVAKAILEIVRAQWTPLDRDKMHFKIKEEGDESDYDDYSGDEDEEPYSDEDGGDVATQIVGKKVDEKFTIDNVGQVSMLVETHVRPLDVIVGLWEGFTTENGTTSKIGLSGLFVYCIHTDNARGLKYLLDWAQDWEKLGPHLDTPETSGSSDRFTFPEDAFEYAVEKGKIDFLGPIIRRAGAGIPLDDLVKKSGVEVKAKAKYYQGLTVYGQKRKDWAMAGRGVVARKTVQKTPPLLQAALAASMESVEFFLSEDPLRLYSEFGKSKTAREDDRLRTLRDSPGGIDRVVATWLGANNDLVIHCVILAAPLPRAYELLEYLIKAYPTAVEKRTYTGETPLMVACRLGMQTFVRILIKGNASQTTRNNRGENIVHAAVSRQPKAHRLRALLDELEPDLRTELFLQRQSLASNANTPIQSWAYSHVGKLHRPGKKSRGKEFTDVVRLIIEYSEGRGLDMLNAAGDTILHIAIMLKEISIVKALVDFQPTLLYRENAVGRTPAELAYDTFIAKQLQRPDKQQTYGRDVMQEYLRENAVDFVRRERAIQDNKSLAAKSDVEALGLSGDYTMAEIGELWRLLGIDVGNKMQSHDYAEYLDINAAIWDLCSTAMRLHPGTRRLVSLNEANDVARRLGEQETGSRYVTASVEIEGDKEEKSEERLWLNVLNPDEHQAWYTYTLTDEEAEKVGVSRCEDCGELHE